MCNLEPVELYETEEKEDNLSEDLKKATDKILEKLDSICKTVDQMTERLKNMIERLDNIAENNRRMRAMLAMTTADNLVTHLRYLRLKYNDLLKPPEDVENEGKNE